MPKRKTNFFIRILKEGTFLILPLGLTIGVISWLFSYLNILVPRSLITSFMPRVFNTFPFGTQVFDLIFILIIIIATILLGMVTSTMFGRFINFLIDKILTAPTFVRPIYLTFKKISEMAFKTDDSEEEFVHKLSQSVIIPYPNEYSYSIGFITNNNADLFFGEEKGKDWLTVYVPSAPLITAGFYLLCKKEDTQVCHLNGAKALSTIISLGTVSNDLPDHSLFIPETSKKNNPIKIWFLNGLLILTPTVSTFFIFNWIFHYLYKILQTITSTLPVIQGIPMNYYDLIMNSILLVLIILLVMFIGLLGESTIGVWVKNGFNRLLNSIPMVNSIYDIVGKITKMFSPDPSSNNKFNQAVLVPYPSEKTFALGFVTGENSSKMKDNGENEIPVFIPTTPIPTTGWFVFSKKEKLIYLDMSIEKAFGLVISAGVLSEKS